MLLVVLSLVKKVNHPWQSLESDFKAVPHSVSPFGGFWSGLASKVGMGNDRAVEIVEPVAESELKTNRPIDEKTPVEVVAKKQEKNRPHVDNTGKVEKKAVPVRTGKEGADLKGYRNFTMADYDEVKRMIESGEMSPTVRPIKNEYLLKNKICVSDQARQEKATWCLETMFDEGVLVLNTVPGKGSQIPPMYMLAPVVAEERAEVESETVDEVGPLEFETSCKHCGNLDINHILTIDQRKGTVLCSGCEKGYVVDIPDDEYSAAIREARENEKS